VAVAPSDDLEPHRYLDIRVERADDDVTEFEQRVLRQLAHMREEQEAEARTRLKGTGCPRLLSPPRGTLTA